MGATLRKKDVIQLFDDALTALSDVIGDQLGGTERHKGKRWYDERWDCITKDKDGFVVVCKDGRRIRVQVTIERKQSVRREHRALPR